jgi:hypothetical protein
LRELDASPTGTDVPVSITISKADLLSDHLAGPFRFSTETSTENWVEDVKATSREVRQLLLDLGEAELVSVAEHYSRVTFHAVSAIGSSPQGAYIQRPVPRRCLDPLGTVLLRLPSALS